MKRPLIFLALLALFVVWTFPHRIVVDRFIEKRFGKLHAEIVIGDVSPRLLPPAYAIDQVTVLQGARTFTLDDVRMGYRPFSGPRVQARFCDGVIEAIVSRVDTSAGPSSAVSVSLRGMSPEGCLDLGTVSLAGRFDGSAELVGLGRGSAGAVLGRFARDGSLLVEARDGVLSGRLPASPRAQTTDGQSAGGRALGAWEFQHARLRARIDGRDLLVEQAEADAENVHWEITAARLSPASAGRTRIALSFRARSVDDTPRSKAVLGMLPRATEAADGWRRYRVTGTLDAPKLVGLK